MSSLQLSPKNRRGLLQRLTTVELAMATGATTGWSASLLISSSIAATK